MNCHSSQDQMNQMALNFHGVHLIFTMFFGSQIQPRFGIIIRCLPPRLGCTEARNWSQETGFYRWEWHTAVSRNFRTLQRMCIYGTYIYTFTWEGFIVPLYTNTWTCSQMHCACICLAPCITCIVIPRPHLWDRGEWELSHTAGGCMCIMCWGGIIYIYW